MLAKKHAQKRRDDREKRGERCTGGETALQAQPKGQGNGGNSEGKAKGLNEFIFIQIKGTQIRNRWHHENAGSSGKNASNNADGRGKQAFCPGRRGGP